MTYSRLQTGQQDYFPAFDWLRITLAMTVALFHAGLPIGADGANFAVQVFFALSGWLIGGILLDSDRRDLPRFYFNRAMRIWAPYYFAVALVFSAGLAMKPLDAQWFEFLFYDVTYTHNWFISPRLAEINDDLPVRGAAVVFWSLSVEEQFYLLAPLLILFLRWGRSPILWGGVALLAVALQTFYGAVALGVCAAALQRRFGDWHLRGAAPVCFALIVAACAGLYWMNPASYNFIAPPAAVAIVLMLARRGARNRVGAFFGGISYPLYLNHWIGVILAKAAALSVPAFAAAFTLGTSAILNLAIASVLFLAIDEPVRKRRSVLFTERRGWMAAMVAYGLVTVGALGGLILSAMR